METFERITPERVEAAYRKSGLRPTQEALYTEIDGVPCGDALGAIFLAENVASAKTCGFLAVRLSKATDEFVMQRMGVPILYTYGFRTGFGDYDLYPGSIDSSIVKKGIEDGQAAARRMGLKVREEN